jgi:hypothetical protein
MSDDAKMMRWIPVECADGTWIVADFSMQPGGLDEWEAVLFAEARNLTDPLEHPMADDVPWETN